MFLKHLLKGSIDISSRGEKPPVILYRDDEEKNKFEDFLLDNISLYDNAEPLYNADTIVEKMKKWSTEMCEYSPVNISKVYNLHKKWKDDSRLSYMLDKKMKVHNIYHRK